jgi:hypothetical protein
MRPVEVGSQVRMKARLAGVRGRYRSIVARFDCLFEVRGADHPVCAARWLGLFIPFDDPEEFSDDRTEDDG